jgi:hypothetical protein
MIGMNAVSCRLTYSPRKRRRRRTLERIVIDERGVG